MARSTLIEPAPATTTIEANGVRKHVERGSFVGATCVGATCVPPKSARRPGPLQERLDADYEGMSKCVRLVYGWADSLGQTARAELSSISLDELAMWLHDEGLYAEPDPAE